MNRNTLLTGIFLFLSISAGMAQNYEIDCTGKPLNKLLIQLREQYNFQLSFDDELLSRFEITLRAKFHSPREVMNALLKDLPLAYEMSGDVFLIFPKAITQPKITYQLTGKILEAGSLEPLPFSHVLINDYATITDLKGSFCYNSTTDSVFRVKVSHLGCYIIDTLIQAGTNQKILLTPSIIGLPEIVVQNNIVERSTQVGEGAGLIRLNSYIANYLPGNGDNSVFNLLRLQPGILAAGEQPNDLIIWGSSEGTSRMYLDGFTIWGLNNFSDQIGAVNPYLAKNVTILKGGYDATNDDVVGGIVDITGKNGSTTLSGFNLFINNQTVNGMMEVPILKKSSLILAFRQTYYNLFKDEELTRSGQQNANNSPATIHISPDYEFHDLNVKYSLQGDNGDLFYLSLLGAEDRFSYTYGQERENNILHQTNKEKNTQTGTTLFFGKNWKRGNRTHFKLSYSSLQSAYDRNRSIERKRPGTSIERLNDHADTDINEITSEIKNELPLSHSHTLKIGTCLIQNKLVLKEDTFNITFINMSEETNRLNLFAQDEIALWPNVKLKTGIRINYPFKIQKTYFDPRLSLNIRPSGTIKLNLAWGHYHQFLVKSSVVDETGNYHYSWSMANGKTIPVMAATHWVAGMAFTRNHFTASLDTYYKTTDGITRYIRFSKNEGQAILEGKDRSYGLDLFVKKDINHHAIWAAYSLGKTEEYYHTIIGEENLPDLPDQEYRRAPQDQRHEFKLAGLFNLKAWHLSASYIYGSGFPLYTNYLKNEYTEPDYQRVDLALIFKFSRKKLSAEAGLSILNLFDTRNIKYNTFTRVPIDQINTIYVNTESVPFTPLLFLKLGF